MSINRSFYSLAGIVREYMQLDPLSTDIFIFLNRSRSQMKILCWEGDGFGIYHKKLEKGTFEFPAISPGQAGTPISYHQLMLILQGITLNKIHYRPRYGQKILCR